MKPYKLIFLGTPNFAATILEKLARNWPPQAVVTAPDKPVGRKRIMTPPPVKVLAEKLKIPVLQPEKVKGPEFIGKIKKLAPDLIILAAYGQFLPKELLDIPKYGSLNIHPSLLPKYRGASPIQAAILAGEKITGVTIILMDEKMDHGPILAKRELEFSILNFQFSRLNEELAKLGAELLLDTLPEWLTGKIKPISQDHSKATFTKIIKKEDSRINWSRPAEYIERMTRAFWPWPGAYTTFNNKILKIIKADILEIKHDKNPGTVFLTEAKRLAIACGKDALIIEELQLEGKRKMTAREFLNGHPEIVGTTIG